jgi:integral membrane protein (TIGR01906 family)
MVAVPLLLTMGSVRLVMTPAFLSLEYNRPGFPDDVFGFTREDRLNYAPFALNYLLNGAAITYLGDLRFPDGKSLYTVEELRHMRDVKIVTQAAFGIAIVVGLATLAGIVFMWRSRALRPTLWQALLNGSLLTGGLIAAIVIGAVFAWDNFFTLFHTIFFAAGTWQFAYSDTLIRLFPEQFWFDAALTIGGLTTAGAVLVGAAAWRWRRAWAE